MGITLVGMRDKLKFPYQGPFDFQIAQTNTSSKAKKIRKKVKKNASQEIDKFSDDGGPSIKDTSHQVKNKKKKEPSLMNNVNEEQVFEDGEAEVLTNVEEGKAGINPEKALNLARKKKTTMNAVAKAAQSELDEETNAPLKSVKNEVSWRKGNGTSDGNHAALDVSKSPLLVYVRGQNNQKKF